MSELFRRSALAIQRRLNDFDRASAGTDPALADGELAPVFILGAPRSGTTLLYQALCRSARVSCISNVMALAPKYMLRLARLSMARAPAPGAPFRGGEYGFLPGLFAPSEAGKVIDRWFDPARTEAHRDPVRRMFAALGERTGRPLLVKALPLALAVDRVRRFLPAARFVVIARDPPYVVQSLFRGQADPALSADRWEGVQPDGFAEHAGRGSEYQTAWQIAEIGRQIAAGLSGIGPHQAARLRYEELCNAPSATLARVCGELDLAVDTAVLPASFPAANTRRVPHETWDRILRACAETGLRG